MAKYKTTVRLPTAKLPRMAAVPRNPKGWNVTEISITGEGAEYATRWQETYPAGEPPEDWTGTRPEWSVFWGLLQNGLQPAKDFQFQARVPGVGQGYYSTVDFLIPNEFIGIEVQGEYWHYGQGSAKIIRDKSRVLAFARMGVEVIFIDETDALHDPEFYVREALAGVDHSNIQRKGF